MAISHRAAGSYVNGTGNLTPAIPATAQAGDMMICVWGSKPYTSDFSIDAGWTLIGDYANGNNSPNVDLGSMRIVMWYKIHTGSETDPTITSTNNAVSGAVINVFQKSASTWEIPVGSGGGDETASASYSALMSSDVGIVAGDLLVAYAAFNSDAALQSSISISVPGALNSSFAESPSSDLATTAGSDMAMSGGYCSITGGSSSGAPTYSSTLASATEGAAFIVRLREAADSISADPETGAVAAEGFAPSTAIALTAIPAPGTVTIAGYAPSVGDSKGVTPTEGSLVFTGYAPAAGMIAETPSGELTLSGFAPEVSLSSNKSIATSRGQVSVTGYSPSISKTDTRNAQPGAGSWIVTGFAPIPATENPVFLGGGDLKIFERVDTDQLCIRGIYDNTLCMRGPVHEYNTCVKPNIDEDDLDSSPIIDEDDLPTNAGEVTKEEFYRADTTLISADELDMTADYWK